MALTPSFFIRESSYLGNVTIRGPQFSLIRATNDFQGAQSAIVSREHDGPDIRRGLAWNPTSLNSFSQFLGVLMRVILWSLPYAFEHA